MKRLNQRGSVGAIALLSIGYFACGGADGTDLLGHDPVLTGNGGTNSAGTGGTANGIAGSSGAANGGSAGSGAGGSSAGTAGSSSNGGTAGSAGAAGTDGNAGSAGTDGNAGSAGTDGNGGTGGTDGDPDGGAGSGGTGGTDGDPDGGVAGTGGGGDPLNLITNPDFELGVSDWTAAFGGTLSASTAQAHGGTHSALVTDRTATYKGAHYDVTDIVELGATYTVSAFAMLGNAASDTVKLTARVQCDGLPDQFLPISTQTGSGSAWTELSGSLVVPTESDCFLHNLLIYVEGPAAGVDLYVDDARMELDDAPTQLTNLITNSGFETGSSDWSAAFGGTLTASAAQAHSGTQSALVTGRSQTYQGAHYDLTDSVDLGATYSFSAFARVGGATSDIVNLTARLQCDGHPYQYLSIDSVMASDTAWTRLSGELVLPSGFDCFMSELLVYAEGPAAGVDLYLDDVKAFETAPAPLLGNLITNSDFEAGVSSWSAAFGGTLTASTAQAHGGTQSAAVTGRGGTYQGAHYDMTNLVEMGGTYSFRAFTRVDGAASDTVNLTALLLCDGQSPRYLQIDTLIASDTDWSLLSGDLVLPPEYDCFKQQLLVYAEGPAAGVDLYVDDVWALETAPAPVVQNLVTNADFEAGVGGWSAAFGGTLGASALQAHSGAQSAAVTGRTGAYEGAHYNMTSLVNPGATYTFSAFARLGGAASDTLNLTAYLQCDGQPNQYVQIDTATASDTGWSLLTGNLAVPAQFACDLNNLLVYVEGAGAGVDIYVDDVWAVQKTAAPALTNLFSNSDFEGGVLPWTAAWGGTMTASTAQAHGGTQSAVVTGRTGGYQGAFYDLTSIAERGATYAFSTFARLGNAPGGATLNMTARITCAGVDQYVQIDTLTGSETSWSQLSGTLAVPAVAACSTLNSLLVYIEGPPAGVDIYVDDAWSVRTGP